MSQLKTLRLRVRDKHAKVLRQMAREVNCVWNYYNELSAKHLTRTGQWLRICPFFSIDILFPPPPGKPRPCRGSRV